MKNILTIFILLLSSTTIGETISDDKIKNIQNELNQNSTIEFYLGGTELMEKYEAALIKNKIEHKILDSGYISYNKKDEVIVKKALDPITLCHFEKKCN